MINRLIKSGWASAQDRSVTDSAVRRQLVMTLYAHPRNIALAALAGILANVLAAISSRSPVLAALTGLMFASAVVRVWIASAMARRGQHVSTRTLEMAFMAGAYVYSLTIGVCAAIALAVPIDADVQALIMINAAVYGVAVCARNAGHPPIAIGQLALSTLPMAGMSIYLGTPTQLVLALSIFLFLPTMTGIVRSMSETLKVSIASAMRSADLAGEMRTLARTDVVTGLANRAGLDHAIGARIAQLADGDLLALFWLDLDRFKEVNDALGHQMGDKVLAEVALRLREAAPPGASIARFGGDEFVLVCEIASRPECERLAAKLLENVTRPLRIGDERLEVPASMGIAILPEDGRNSETLMRTADLALYHAKVGGKNHSRFYDRAMSRELARRREIEVELRAAIQRDELSIFFQPIVDLATGRIRTFEALVRWFHPEKGELRPDEFIPLAEETGVIVTLGNWITKQAARAATFWPDEVSIAVNLSPLQIKAPGAALGILAALRETGLNPARLELEVTERLFLEDDHATAHFITELSKAGVKFALDDFGTGYSSLNYIDKFPFHTIKVDRSFVSGPNAGRRSGAIIRAVAELGSQLDMAIVAEGLETLDQVKSVRAAGCTLGQGYYFSRAVPDYLAALLLAQERDDGTARKIA